MKLTLYKNSEDLIVKLNSMLVALLLASNTITLTASKLYMKPGIQYNLITLILASIIIFITLIKRQKITMETPALLVLAMVTIWYVYTLIFHSSNTSLTIIQFIFYAVLPIYAISQKLDGEYVLRYTLYFSLVTILAVNKFFVIQHEQYDQAFMGNIFPLLTPVMAAMIHFRFYRKNANFLIIVSYIYTIYLILKLILYANRGLIFCLLFCLIILLVNSYDNNTRKKLSALKIFVIVIAGIIGVIAIINSLSILKFMSDWCMSTFKSVPSFITKMITYIELGDISDGRSVIDSFTLEQFFNHPFVGHGIETFSKVAHSTIGAKWPYPHQYIYQYLFEGGIVFGLIPVYLSLSLSVKVWFTRIIDKKEFVLCCIISCSCIPKLLLSADPWASTTIWMLIAYSMIYIFKTNKFVKNVFNRNANPRRHGMQSNNGGKYGL